MNKNIKYVKDFFELMGSISQSEHVYMVSGALDDFFKDETTAKAYAVYQSFFDCYRLKTEGKRSFIDVLDVLKQYEENAGELNDKQRDHYIHSVNVFQLGLAIYAQNATMRQAFSDFLTRGDKEYISYSNIHEEFLFRWGIAALLHDIGYPVEIINSQLRSYITFISGGADAVKSINPYISYFDFNQLQLIDVQDKLCDFAPVFLEYYPNAYRLDPIRALDLVSASIDRTYHVGMETIRKNIDTYLDRMQQFGFVDHGFYSTMIVLKWFGDLSIQAENGADLLYSPILESAVAILLHNYYRRGLMKEPFNLGRFSVFDHPIAFLLAFCDEAQEWNRKAYGKKDRMKTNVDSSEVVIRKDSIHIHYITKIGALTEQFLNEKKSLYDSVFDTKALFPKGVVITATTLTDQYISMIKLTATRVMPRPLVENIELLARWIHEDYNAEELAHNPDKPLDYPTWDDLEDTMKYSNVRQANGFFDKLAALGCYATDEETDDERVEAFSDEELEYLARLEHNDWYEERIRTGWKYGPEKDVAKHISPYLVPYDELSEDVRAKDRKPMQNIIPFIERLGMKVYRE